MECKVLLFDLGGVLVDIPTKADIRAVVAPTATDDEFEELWLMDVLWGEFELGRISPDEFIAAWIDGWSLTLTAEELLKEFRSWTKGLLPGAAELLDELRPRYQLVALSNSNPVHWQRNKVELGVEALFEQAFSSHQLGLRKPTRDIYDHVLNTLGVEAGEVIFFDDTAENVEAAQSLGMLAFQVRGVEETRRCLEELGVLAALPSLHGDARATSDDFELR